MGLYTDEGRIQISPSRLKTWRDCPLKWHAMYVEGKRFVPTPSMLFGTAMHRALELFHKGLWLGSPVTLPELQEAFLEALRSGAAEDDVSVEKELPSFQASSEALLETYVERFTGEVTAAELSLSAPLFDPTTGEDLGADLVGIIDLVSEGRLIDIKTSARRPDLFGSTLSHQIQMEAYRWLVSSCAPELEIRGAGLRTLVRTKKPVIEELDIPLRKEGAFLDVCTAYIAAIEEIPRPRPGLLCNASCPGYESCRAHHALEVA